mmetsp:Transcript_43939/g.71479  ORF Transcript_43939/g.71479 Transcript_43939/m.71479 type:complete len:194 (-) Transcript_43939:1003-1584(-)|eukprot:CAMPEP_0184657554 /NCGR_PEP_ID=MMETSP0308-20130426/20298_1 /TAXON_ID=38269 /ORGANISM="Gloeochaete witrockiana, Strain SAG 46.84" /LENGTH=193 /DNA_ID=CAMNT_0027095525 /DNA_START=250 /DNA_END=831 /DNA_ORIENTATION=-
MGVEGYTECKFNYPWQNVIEAYLTKYPTPHEKAILSVDTMEQRYDSELKITYLKRRFTSVNPAPWFIRKILRAPFLHWIEDVERDDLQMQMRCRTINESFSSLVHCEERSSYTADPMDPTSRTVFQMRGMIDAHGLGVLKGPCESFCTYFMKDGVVRSLKLLDMKLAGMIVDINPEATFSGDDVIIQTTCQPS